MTTKALKRLTTSAAVTALFGAAACASNPPEPSQQPAPAAAPAAVTAAPAPVAAARPDSGKWTAADVKFMTGMIGHHAQALVMAKMAPTHGASQTILTLTGRIINAQNDEIAIMQTWLRDRNQPVPDPVSGMHAGHDMAGMQHELMPGMLTNEQLAQLDAARGPDFDVMFLKLMIQHHEGAVAMVKELINTPGAAQDDQVFKISSDINVDQATEIARMKRMLVELLFGKESQ